MQQHLVILIPLNFFLTYNYSNQLPVKTIYSIWTRITFFSRMTSILTIYYCYWRRYFFYLCNVSVFKEKFNGQFEVTNQEWQDELQDSESTVYKVLKNKCTQIVSSNSLLYLNGRNIFIVFIKYNQ
jgi:hypothetical protein